MQADVLDVLVVGAGISGISAGVHLQQRCPDHRFEILEARERLGGTWDLFRYPGVRSDSDMHTLGFRFKPWTERQAIARGPAIWNYLDETVREHGLDRHIRYGQRLIRATWSTAQSCWILSVGQVADGTEREMRARFLFLCCGYYRYDQGYLPDYPGQQDYRGRLIHPGAAAARRAGAGVREERAAGDRAVRGPISRAPTSAACCGTCAGAACRSARPTTATRARCGR